MSRYLNRLKKIQIRIFVPNLNFGKLSYTIGLPISQWYGINNAKVPKTLKSVIKVFKLLENKIFSFT